MPCWFHLNSWIQGKENGAGLKRLNRSQAFLGHSESCSERVEVNNKVRSSSGRGDREMWEMQALRLTQHCEHSSGSVYSTPLAASSREWDWRWEGGVEKGCNNTYLLHRAALAWIKPVFTAIQCLLQNLQNRNLNLLYLGKGRPVTVHASGATD